MVNCGKKSHQNYYPLLIKYRITSLRTCQIIEIMLLFKIRRKIVLAQRTNMLALPEAVLQGSVNGWGSTHWVPTPLWFHTFSALPTESLIWS